MMGWTWVEPMAGSPVGGSGFSWSDLQPLLDRIEMLEERVHALDGLPPEPRPKPQPVRGPEFHAPCPDCRVAPGQPHAEGCTLTAPEVGM